MATWEEFEVQCTNYLNSRFGHYAIFFHQGGADSTVPDILVKTNSGKSFYIDAKHSPAQCGQFVLLPNLGNRTFEYSPKNVNLINRYAEMIMNYMNQDFDAFIEAGVSGKDIYIKNSSDIFANWIIQTYKNKGVRFFITNQYTLLPIERFSDYFEVTAKYRIKRSGSTNVGRSRIPSVMDYIDAHGYAVTGTHINSDKLFISSSRNLHDCRFILHGIEYMFSFRGDKYELRKLSNTYNANVIFSIRQKSSKGMSDNEFIRCLR